MRAWQPDMPFAADGGRPRRWRTVLQLEGAGMKLRRALPIASADRYVNLLIGFTSVVVISRLLTPTEGRSPWLCACSR